MHRCSPDALCHDSLLTHFIFLRAVPTTRHPALNKFPEKDKLIDVLRFAFKSRTARNLLSIPVVAFPTPAARTPHDNASSDAN